jgi:hypothetical protein
MGSRGHGQGAAAVAEDARIQAARPRRGRVQTVATYGDDATRLLEGQQPQRLRDIWLCAAFLPAPVPSGAESAAGSMFEIRVREWRILISYFVSALDCMIQLQIQYNILAWTHLNY